MAKKTRITRATIDAPPARSSRRTDGPSLVHSVDPRGAPRRAQQIGEQIDRAGGQRRRRPARPARARARERARAGRRSIARRRPAELRGQRRAASRAAARAGSRGGEDDSSQQRQQLRAASPAASLSSRTADARDERPAGQEAAQRLGQRRHAARVVRAVEDRHRLVGDDLEAPGHRASRGRVGDRLRVERAEEAPVRPLAASAKLRRWKRARGGERDAAGPARRRSARRARRRRARRPRAPPGCRSGPTTSVPPGRTTSTFSPAMSAIVGPSQRVCSSPTLVSTCTRESITFVAS